MMRPKNWIPGVFSKPKNFHSLEHLKYLHSVLCKHNNVTESNRSLLVESLRCISEILIWGDQNDGSVFDFFLEKNMLSFFLSYIQQRYGRYICVQILQTLNILFENISNETSLYYLLSNNHINSIIVHKFDFSDEEVMAYFISFLKTLSFKLNKHTIHFFYNEHANDFALYTEAIKFFNHSESMVRIAVRTITLNVYKVGDTAMLRYIRDRTAAPYFFNLVWFIGVHVLDLDCCVRNDADHLSRTRLEDLVAEHLDHLHYLNDILCLNIDALNDILTDHLLNRLFIPLYVYSLSQYNHNSLDLNERKHVSVDVALFLLTQVFLIISHAPLVRQLAETIFHADVDKDKFEHTDSFPRARVRAFTPPKETLAVSLASLNRRTSSSSANSSLKPSPSHTVQVEGSLGSGHQAHALDDDVAAIAASIPQDDAKARSADVVELSNITDEEKMGSLQQSSSLQLTSRPFLSTIFSALDCIENDYGTLFSLCVLYALGNNEGISQSLMDTVLMPTNRSECKSNYNVPLVEKLINLITSSAQPGSKVRLVTLELSMRLLKQLVYKPGCSYLQDRHLAAVEHARETSSQILRNFYKTEEIFLDMFEDEYNEMKTRPFNVEYLMMDASILLTPTGTPLTGIDFNKRLPCGDTERSRKAIRVFLMIRDLSLTLLNEQETCLPFAKDEKTVTVDNVLDLNNSDLIACTITTKDVRRPERRFLVIDCQQLILVEPDTKRLGWGVVRFVGLLQDVVVSGDKDDSRSLHVTVYKPIRSPHSHPSPLLSAKFIFDDHIRCMAAKQRLTKGRNKARNHKIQAVERLLDIYSGPHSAQAQVQYTPAPLGPALPGRGHLVRQFGGASSHQSHSAGSSPLHENAAPPDSRLADVIGSTSLPQDYIVNSCHSSDYIKPIISDATLASKSSSPVYSENLNLRSHSSAVVAGPSAKLTDSDTTTKKINTTEEQTSSGSTVPTKSPCQEIQKVALKRIDTPCHITKQSKAHDQHSNVKTRSHSQSPARGSARSTKERSKSLTSEKLCRKEETPGILCNKQETTSTACQTTKSLLVSHTVRHASPKTLQLAKTPSVSLLQQPDSEPSHTVPKLMPPIEVERVRKLSEKSMKSQITELAQIVQQHYNYQN